MKGNDNKFLTGGFTMKQICKIYSSTISFIRAFERAAGVVVLSTTLMFNCATTKSADTSSRYVAESTTTSQEVNYKGDPNETKLQKLVNKAAELAIKSQQLYEIEEQARQEKEQACKGMYNALMEMKELCKKGDKKNCEDYKECLPQYEEMCGKK
jgi:signal transduction histidine kinase